MSNFQALVESNRRLNETVENKVGEIDQAVAQAQDEFESFKQSADARYYSGESRTLRIDGDGDKFYPVSFPLTGGSVPNVPGSDVSGRVHHFHILKHVSNFAGGDGTFRLIMDVATTSWGGFQPFMEPDCHDYTVKPFLGNYRYGAWGFEWVVWLRGGGRTYSYQSSWGIVPTLHMERVNLTTLQWDEATGLTYPDWVEPIDAVDAGMPAAGFRR